MKIIKILKKNCDDIEKEIKVFKEKNNQLIIKMNNNVLNNNDKIKTEINEIKKTTKI